LETVTECVNNIAVTCNVGSLQLDISAELHRKLVTNQQLYCPIEEYDFYTARACISTMYEELELLSFNSRNKWCALLSEDELDEIDSAFDWAVTDIDAEHNSLCQQKYFCRLALNLL
jgi:hypothetical protein